MALTTKPKMDTERVLKRLLTKYTLVRIDFRVTERTVYAEAMPQAYHPLVAKRQEADVRAAADANGSIGLQEASRIGAEARGKPIAVAYGDTIEDALFDLERALKAL
jgi:hypothetical protein